MELRVFVPEGCDYDVFEELNKKLNRRKYEGNKVNSETRTDLYINLNHPGYGLKLRHGKSLELKERLNVVGNVEHWKKTVLKYSKSTEPTPQNLKEALKKFPEVCKLLDNIPELDLLTFEKTRKSFPIDEGSTLNFSCCAEQTDMVIKRNGTVCAKFRSINFEDAPAEHLNRAYDHLFNSTQKQSHHLMGYPELVMLISSTK
eukprot:TRINITY_DN27212_c0_g1_i1.p1 TRINITY_DN27212_c0_g1~~TRINITY_DN27212_c0_g1_i1.p1  ORF type:complete len:202 (-),score=49.76 TRINITY_DN27212_c0_g1_i1:19-624(-)